MRTLYPARSGGRLLGVEDLWALPRVDAPVPAPGAPLLAVAVRRFDMEKNAGRSRIWLLPLDGAEPRPLTSAESDSTQPAFSPDAKRLAFVRKEGEQAQLFVMPLDGGEAERVTDLPFGVTDPRWLPDGSGVAFVAELLEGHLSIEATRRELERRAQDPVKAVVTEDRLYRYWDHFLAGGRVSHLFVADLASGAVRDLTADWSERFDLMELNGCYDLAPDGSEAAFASELGEGEPGEERLRSAVYTVPVEGGPVTPLTLDEAPRAFRPRYTPDGRGLTYGWTQDLTFYADRVRLNRYDRGARKHEPLLVDWDLSPEAWEWTPAGELVFTAQVDGRTCLFAVGSEAEPRRLTQDGSASPARTGSDGRLYFTHQSLQAPAEVHAVSLEGGEPARLSRFTDEGLAGIALGEVRELWIEGGGGERVQVWVVLPSDYRESSPRPLVHVVHGGPHGITGDSFHPRWNAQLFAAPGYVVAAVNFQGSTSRGQDFARRIRGAWGELPAQDVMAATEALVESGLVDRERMALAGGSYGGYLASWLATQTNRFRCVVNHAGVFDLLAQYATDVTHGRAESFGGSAWEGLERIDRWSPARATSGLETPMLVLHGERDFRVPVTHGLQCYNILKAKGVPARLVYFPDENHWVLKPRNSRLWYAEVHAWLARHLSQA